MATILLSAAGAAIGGAFGGTAFGMSAAILGRAVGATLGRAIDQRLLGNGSQIIETGEIERFQLTGASEGTSVGTNYGRVRTGGQIIWASNFLERVKTEDVGGKGGGASTTTKSYSYSISIAVALCEGEISGIGRIWADGMEVARDDFNMRIYTGTEDQLPDPKIEAIEGIKNAPAYRGLAYVVFSNLSLGKFGNRVPQFSFEVTRPVDPTLVPLSEQSLSQTIRAVALIPGTGEYSLATTKVNYSNLFGWKKSANVHSNNGRTDFVTSLEQMNTELPKCDSVSLVVSWFGDDLRCGACSLVPKVEHSDSEGDRMRWQVSGLKREDALEVSKVDGRSVYGGTPTDQSVVEAIKALKDAGKSVVFYPFILMEQLDGNTLPDPWSGGVGQPSFPWRGRITTQLAPGLAGTTDGTPDAAWEVSSFFGTAGAGDFSGSGNTVTYSGPHEWSFRRFILHYAHLCAQAGGVKAFCIGSELRSLTQIRGADNSFPAVNELVALADDVRSILGPDTKVGYAADWSEYFGYHPQDGSSDVFFHLDPLWASDNIDFIGIDNYMPLSDWRDTHDHADSHWRSIYNLDYLKANIEGGEGYDWFYADLTGRENQDRLAISDGAHGEPWVYRYKDIRNWWSQPHHNRIGGVRQERATAWVPQGKPIWFTEIGCAALDKGTNQPNKFLDPKSSESSPPWFSSGIRDDYVQMQYLRATYQYWSNRENNPVSEVYSGEMVDVGQAHVWAWDARPYPDFPARSKIWSDAGNYAHGHWLNGRATSESLAAVVSDICGRSGATDLDVSELYGLVRGYGVNGTAGARAALQPLELAHGFDVAERGGKLKFRSRTGIPDVEIDTETIVALDGASLTLERGSLGDSAGKIRLNYVQADGGFETCSTEASIPDQDELTVSSSDLAMCLTGSESRKVAERWLAESRVARDVARFALPPSLSHVLAGDVIGLRYGGRTANYRVDRVEISEAQQIEAVRVEPDLFKASSEIGERISLPVANVAMPVMAKFLDLPMIDGTEDPVAPYLAVNADPWPGSVAVFSASEDDGYALNTTIEEPTVVGVIETPLKMASPGVPDLGAVLRVKVSGGVLSSVSRTALLNGANAMAIRGGDGGDWEVLQFRNAELVGEDTYELSYLLRGQLGTDATMPEEWPAGSFVVKLDGAPGQIVLPSAARGLERHYRIGPADQGYADESYEHLVHSSTSVGLRPYRPVHLRSTRQADGGLWLTWVRRGRIDGDSWEGIDIPLGEEHERYLVQVIEEKKVVREVQTSSAEWFYTNEMRMADALTGSFAIQVAQLSERYGAGPFQRIDVDE